ncbi:MAG: FkbM family methyltransferase [Dehalococcoidia bacterium]
MALVNAMPPQVASQLQSERQLTRVLRPVVNRLLPQNPTPIVVRAGPAEGLRLVIFPWQEKYYWTGMHEVPVQRALARILRPGMIFWDVGAHIGLMSLIAARLVGEMGRVHAFEPMNENRARLLASIDLNGFDNITVQDKAMAATCGSTILFSNRASTMWTLVPARGEENGVVVDCLTLDEYACHNRTPDLIKIDAEGAEVDVLRGGERLLCDQRPAVVVEFSNYLLLNEARTLFPFYRFQRLSGYHWLLT